MEYSTSYKQRDPNEEYNLNECVLQESFIW